MVFLPDPRAARRFLTTRVLLTPRHLRFAEDCSIQLGIPIRPELRTAIDTTPSGNLVYVATSHGTPFQSSKGFSQWFVDQRKSAGLPDKCRPHGLRKTAAARLAEAGVGEFMLMSVMGWTNPNQARKYIEKASRAKMAGKAMQMLDEEQT